MDVLGKKIIICPNCGSRVREDLFDHHQRVNCGRPKIKRPKVPGYSPGKKPSPVYSNCQYCGRSIRLEVLNDHVRAFHSEKVVEPKRRFKKDALDHAFYGGRFEGNRRRH